MDLISEQGNCRFQRKKNYKEEQMLAFLTIY